MLIKLEQDPIVLQYLNVIKEVIESLKDVPKLNMSSYETRFSVATGFGVWVHDSQPDNIAVPEEEVETVIPKVYAGRWKTTELPEPKKLQEALVNITGWILAGETCKEVLEWSREEGAWVCECPTLNVPPLPPVDNRALIVRVPWTVEIDREWHHLEEYMTIRARLGSCLAEWLGVPLKTQEVEPSVPSKD